jgi:RNA polymerase sigma factor for flagellar operon FliA
MLDEVRRSDWTPRSVHKKSRMVSEAIKVIEHKTGSAARDVDVAAYLGLPLDEYNLILQDSNSCRIFSMEELAESGDHYFEESYARDIEPDDSLSRDGFQQALAKAILCLPERERLVISLYYDDELNLREIGEVLSISESRVSQISAQAVLRLRSRLSGWLNDD